MDYKKLNKILKNLQNPIRDLEFIQTGEIRNGIPDGMEGMQGEENSFYKIYRVKGEDLIISVEYYTDSYGDGEYIRGIQFVKEAEKTVKAYNPL